MLNQMRALSGRPILGVLLLLVSAPWACAAPHVANRNSAFDANCSMCHQLRAAGVPGQFPRLAGRADRIASTTSGRRYLERVVLYGMMGNVTIDGTPIVGGVMPPFSSLSNSDLAAALNYVVSLDAKGRLHWRGAVFKSADIARARAGKVLSPMQVHKLRAATLGKSKS